MLRNMLLRKYVFKLNLLLFTLKIIEFVLFLSGFIFHLLCSVSSLLVFKAEWIGFTYFPLLLSLYTNGFLVKANEFAKYRDNFDFFPVLVDKNLFRFEKKWYRNAENRSVFVENLYGFITNLNGFLANSRGFGSMLRNIRTGRKRSLATIKCPISAVQPN